MKLVGARDFPQSSGVDCQQAGGALGRRLAQIVVVCLDPAHCNSIVGWANPTLVSACCPVQALRLLDSEPRQRVILDRCPARLVCCRRASPALQRVIHHMVHRHGAELKVPSNTVLPSFPGSMSTPDLAKRVRQICNRWLGTSQKASLSDLAAAFGVSPRHLNRLFHAAGAGPPMKVFRKEWFQEAIAVLESASPPIETIAEDFGYSDRSSFSRGFRRALGIYPSRLRRSLS